VLIKRPGGLLGATRGGVVAADAAAVVAAAPDHSAPMLWLRVCDVLMVTYRIGSLCV